MPIKFTSDKKNLLSLFVPAAGAASNKTTLPALEGLLMNLRGEELTVCGYDLEKGVQTKGTVTPPSTRARPGTSRCTS